MLEHRDTNSTGCFCSWFWSAWRSPALWCAPSWCVDTANRRRAAIVWWPHGRRRS